jgi:hypothetical protein
MAMNSWFSITWSTSSSSTKTAFDLLDEPLGALLSENKTATTHEQWQHTNGSDSSG